MKNLRGLALASLGLFILFFAVEIAHAQAGAAQIFYARDYATGGDGSGANPWSSASGTGGIQEAVDACGCGYSSQGCTIILPRGVVRITQSIEIGTKLTQSGSCTGAKNGLVFRGHGNGFRTNSGNPSTDVHLAGTTLRVEPGTGMIRPVLRLQGVSFSSFSDFSIDGNNEAPIGIESTAEGDYFTTGQQNLFENILVERLTNTGIQVGPLGCVDWNSPSCGGQVSETSWRHIFTKSVPVGFRQFGAQTTSQRIENSNITCTDRCIEFYDGEGYVTDSFVSTLGASTPRADIWIGKNMNDVLLIGNVHESCAKSMIEGESGVRHYTTTMVQNRLQHYYCGATTNPLCTAGYCYLVNFDQTGTFNMFGGEYHHNQNVSLAERPRLRFQNTFSTQGTLRVNSSGNSYWSTVAWDTIPINAVLINSSDELTGGLFRQTYSTMRNIGLGTDYPLAFQSTDPTVGTKLLGWLTPAARFRLNDPSAGIEFSASTSGNVLSLNPPASLPGATTVTIPPKTGTLAISGDTLGGDLQGTLDASGTSSILIRDNNVEPSDMNSTNAATTGLCLTKAGGDQFTWSTCGSAPPVETDTLVFSTNATTISAARYLGPNVGSNNATENLVSVPMSARTAKSLRCKVSVAPASGKSWTLTARAAGATLLSCQILAGQTSCSVTSGSAPWAAGAAVSLLATPNGGPAATIVTCALGVAP